MLTHFFAEGGFGMYPTLAFGVLLLAVGAFDAIKPERRSNALFVTLGLVVFGCGALGFTLGVVTTPYYVAKLPPAERYATALMGVAESLHNVALALFFIVLSTLLLAVGAARTARSSPGAPSEPRVSPE